LVRCSTIPETGRISCCAPPIDPIEKEVYALSVGKLTRGGLVRALQERTGIPGDASTVLENRVLPALRRLEAHYQVIFHN